MQKSFFMLKGEAYMLAKSAYIIQRVQDSDLQIFAHWQVHITAGDVLEMYPGWLPRITILARMPFLYDCDVFWVKGTDAIRRMDEVKHQIRDELWGFRCEKGGFLHAPDTEADLQHHAAVLWQRLVPVTSPA